METVGHSTAPSSAPRYRGLRALARAFQVLGYVGIAWGVLLLAILLGEVEGWQDGMVLGVLVTLGVGCCVASFAASQLLRLAANLADDVRVLRRGAPDA